MQADATAAVPCVEMAETLAAAHRRPGRDPVAYRFIGRGETFPVLERQHTPSRHDSTKGDHAVGRRDDLRMGDRGQVDAAVSRAPSGGGRVETTNEVVRRDRPAESRRRTMMAVCRRRPAVRECHCRSNSERQRQDEPDEPMR